MRDVIDWLKRLFSGASPRPNWAVEVTEHEIRVTDHVGQGGSISKLDLTRVVIATDDSGPLGDDVVWLLYDADDQLACLFPIDADGQKDAVAYLMALPGFDEATMIDAMGSTRVERFLVWSREVDGSEA